MKLYRVILLVNDINRAAAFYGQLLQSPGNRVSPGRRYFDCGGTILACYDPAADGDDQPFKPNPDHIYLATDGLEAAFERAKNSAMSLDPEGIRRRPWGERSFYGEDPFGNRICIVDQETVFTG